jgi:hypothetical protein
LCFKAFGKKLQRPFNCVINIHAVLFSSIPARLFKSCFTVGRKLIQILPTKKARSSIAATKVKSLTVTESTEEEFLKQPFLSFCGTKN